MSKLNKQCVMCGKIPSKIYHQGKYYCCTPHFNEAREAPVFDPRKMRPEAFYEKEKRA